MEELGRLQFSNKAWDSLSKYAGYWMKHFSEADISGTIDIESSIAQIHAAASAQKSLTWAHVYQLAPRWSPSPAHYQVNVRLNALDMASFHGHAVMVKLFLKDYNATEKGISSIRWALQNKHTIVAHVLLDSISSNSTHGHILNAAFHIACSVGEESVSRLMAYPVIDPCRADSLGRTTLFWASRGGNEMIVRQLIEVREHRNWPKDDIAASLMAAAYRGLGDVITLLIHYGPAESNECRITVLFQAVSLDHAQVLQISLDDCGSLAIPQSELEKLIVMTLKYGRKKSFEVSPPVSFQCQCSG